MFLSSRKNDPGCSSRILKPDPDLDFLPNPGSQGGNTGHTSSLLTRLPMRLLMRTGWPTAFFACLHLWKLEKPISWIVLRSSSFVPIGKIEITKILSVIEKNFIKKIKPPWAYRGQLSVSMGNPLTLTTLRTLVRCWEPRHLATMIIGLYLIVQSQFQIHKSDETFDK